MGFKIVTATLATAVANAGTVTLPYPAGTTQASFTGANASADGALVLNDNDLFKEAVSGVRVNYTYGGSNITLTNNTGISWPAGSTIIAQLGQAGNDRPAFQPNPAIADAAAAGGTYAQAEANATVATVNAILRALRAQGVIKS
jgi:hypothetical protein